MDTCVCMTKSVHCPPETISTLLISYAAAAKSRHSHLILCDPIDGSPPGSSVPGILQARTLPMQNKKFKQICLPSRLTFIENFLCCKHDSKCHMLKFPHPPTGGGLSIILPYTQGRDTENLRNSSKTARRASREACARIQEAWPQSVVVVGMRHRLRLHSGLPLFLNDGLKKKKKSHPLWTSPELVLPRTVYPDFLQRCCWNQQGAFCLSLRRDPPQLSTSSQLRPVINICRKGEEEKRGESCLYFKKSSILVARAGTLDRYSVVLSILSCGSHIGRESLLLHHQLLCDSVASKHGDGREESKKRLPPP